MIRLTMRCRFDKLKALELADGQRTAGSFDQG
jgi:hypothetical protein